MKKLIIFTMLVALSGTLRAQNDIAIAAPAITAATTGEELGQVDNAIKGLATEIAKQLSKERVQTVALGQFPYMGTLTPFNTYLNNQLTGDLAAISPRSFTLLPDNNAAEVVVSGEIVRIADIIRVYARLVQRESNTVVLQTSVDLGINTSLSSMLSPIDGDAISAASAYVAPDQWETDRM